MEGDEMRVATKLCRGVLTLAVAAAPFMLGRGAANADPNDRTQDRQTAAFTFINDSLHETVTCQVTVIRHDYPDQASLAANTTADFSHNPNVSLI